MARGGFARAIFAGNRRFEAILSKIFRRNEGDSDMMDMDVRLCSFMFVCALMMVVDVLF